MVVVFSDTWEISILCIGVSLFFITLPALTVLGFTNWNELKPHCGFYLHVPGCWWTWAFFICLSFEFYLWAMSVHILCPFLSSTVIYRSRIWILISCRICKYLVSFFWLPLYLIDSFLCSVEALEPAVIPFVLALVAFASGVLSKKPLITAVSYCNIFL